MAPRVGAKNRIVDEEQKVFSMRIPLSVYNSLLEIAKADGVSVSYVINDILEEYRNV